MNLITTLFWLFSAAVHVSAVWQSLYSPLYDTAYLKLSTEEIIAIDYSGTKLKSGDSISNIISSPTSSNYSLALANGNLYALYADEEDDDRLEFSKLNKDTGKWEVIKYNTTLTKNLQYYSDSTILANLPSDDDTKEAIYIYGGKSNNSVSNRLLEFNPETKRLNSINTSISPTAFYGATGATISSKGEASVAVGGKASSGWVSMFQIAVWEYKSWSFKTVSTADFGVNSRINSLVLPSFNDKTKNVDSLFLLGGTLGDNLSSPYVLSLNITNTWKWSNLTNVGDFKINNCLGAFALNGTLISIGSSDSKKRSNSYSLQIYDLNSMKKVDQISYAASTSTLEPSTKPSSSTSSSAAALSSSSSNAQSQTQSQSQSQSQTQTQLQSQSPSESQVQSSGSSSEPPSSASSPTSTTTSENSGPAEKSNKSKTVTIVVSVIVPIIAVMLVIIAIRFIYKKYKRSQISLEQSDSESTNTDEYYREMNDLVDTQSISSWNEKRAEYEHKRLSKHTVSSTPKSPPIPRKSAEFSFENSIKRNLMSIYKPQLAHHSPSKRSSGPFVQPDDLEDEYANHHHHHQNGVNVSPFTINSNKSRNSFNSLHPTTISSSSSEDYEEKKIEEMLQDRDVQVLVSSKRRSKLRITNPDLESLKSIREVSDSSTTSSQRVSSSASGSSVSNTDISNELYERDAFHLGDPGMDNQEDDAYFKEVLKFFDEEGP